MSLADIFGDYDFSDYGSNTLLPGEFSSDAQFQIEDDFFQDTPAFISYDPDPNISYAQDFYSGTEEALSSRGFSEGEIYPEIEDERSLAKQAQDFLFDTLGVGPETAKAISAFAKRAQKGGGKERQAQGSGRTGPALPTSARAPTTPAGRTSRARQATSGERAIQAAISQSNRAQSAARAIANQMAKAGTVTSTNDLADMISGATSPKGTKQALPGTRLRQLAIPRTA